MLRGQVVADDPPSDPFGEQAGAGAFLHGYLAGMVGRALASPADRVVEHGGAHPAAPALDFMGTKPGKASIRPIQATIAG